MFNYISIIMNKIKSLLIILTSLFTLCSYAADTPKDILDKVAAKFERSQGMSIDFILHEGNSKSKGNLKIRKEKYCFSVEGAKIWFDGKTMWTYIKENEEVNITSPTEEEIRKTSPLSFLYMYNNGYDLKTSSSNTNYYEITMTRSASSDTSARITVRINKKTYNPEIVKIEDKNNVVSVNVLSITETKIEDAEFRFEKNLYPNVDEIDLR